MELEKYWSLFPKSVLVILCLCIFLYGLIYCPKIRYYYAYFLLILVQTLAGCVYFLIFLILGRCPSNIRLMQPTGALLSKLLGIKWEVRNGEILAVDQAAVIIMNHQTDFDLVGITYISNLLKKVVLVSRISMACVFPLSLNLWQCRAIFINPTYGKYSNKQLVDGCRKLSKNKDKLLIFPEGALNQSSEKLCPFKRGAFRAAIECKVPILPIVFSPFYFFDNKKKTFEGGHMIIKALEPIDTAKFTKEDVDYLKDNAWELMQEEYSKLREEVYSKYVYSSHV